MCVLSIKVPIRNVRKLIVCTSYIYMCVCTINKSAHTKKVWKLNLCTSYILGVKLNIPAKVVALSPTTQCSSYLKGSLPVANFTFPFFIFMVTWFRLVIHGKCSAYHLFSKLCINRISPKFSRCLTIWVFVRQCSGRPGFSPRSSHTKNSKMVLDTVYLLNTQHYKVRIKGKVDQSREWGGALPFTFV